MPSIRRPVRNEVVLVRLLGEIRRARAAYRACGDVPSTPTAEVVKARSVVQLAEAMQSYAEAAADAGVPLPHRFHLDMRIYRAMIRRLPDATEVDGADSLAKERRPVNVPTSSRARRPA